MPMSVGGRGNSYDSAVAGSVIGFLKVELVLWESSGRRINDLKLETLGWVGRSITDGNSVRPVA